MGPILHQIYQIALSESSKSMRREAPNKNVYNRIENRITFKIRTR